MGVREIQVADTTLVIHELEDVCDSVTGRVLTGSWLWNSSLVLSEWIATQGRLTFDFHDKTVLELGAGAGLPGLTAALLGASRVPSRPDLSRVGASRLRHVADAARRGTDTRTTVSAARRRVRAYRTRVRRLWGRTRAFQLINNIEVNGLGDRVEVRQLVWGSDESSSEFYGFDFDLVLMSDVFFDMEEMAALAKTLKKVCRKETVVWAESEVRPWTGECLNVLVSEGFGVVEFPSQLGGSIGSGNPFMEEDSLDTFAVFLLLPPNEDSHVAAVCN
nr:hypothetical protein CFP56_16387 [Quercus suber]